MLNILSTVVFKKQEGESLKKKELRSQVIHVRTKKPFKSLGERKMHFE